MTTKTDRSTPNDSRLGAGPETQIHEDWATSALDSFQKVKWNGSMKDALTALRDAGLRITKQRIAVLDAVGENPHTVVDRILAAVREKLGTVSTQAVYDALAALTEAGLVRRIEPAGSPARFERRVGDNHHHVVCRTCGEIEDVDCAVGFTPCLRANETHGYLIDEAEVVYWGKCPDCAALEAGTGAYMS